MLKLIQCEMRKLKRKHFVSFVVFSAFLFPIPFTALVLAGSVGNFTGFEAVFGLLATMGMPIMLPAVPMFSVSSLLLCYHQFHAFYLFDLHHGPLGNGGSVRGAGRPFLPVHHRATTTIDRGVHR